MDKLELHATDGNGRGFRLDVNVFFITGRDDDSSRSRRVIRRADGELK